MRLTRSDFTGTGKVFVFTLMQQLKNRANQISLLIILLFALLALPVAALLMGGGSTDGTPAELSGYVVRSFDGAEYFGTDDFLSVFPIQYGFSILVLMLCVFSSSFIIRSVVDEKASKLVELLMVSVKPLALITGKILAVMVYVFGQFAAMFVCLWLSFFLTPMFLDTTAVDRALAASPVFSSLLSFDLWTLVVAFVSLILGYLTFSILAGLVGVGCSTVEDMEPASLSAMIPVLAGYIVSCVSTGFHGGSALFFALCPIVSVFCAPVSYALGNIGLGTLCLSWILQAVVVFLLARLCAGVYGALILYKGSRIRFKQLFAIAKQQKGASV